MKAIRYEMKSLLWKDQMIVQPPCREIAQKEKILCNGNSRPAEVGKKEKRHNLIGKRMRKENIRLITMFQKN